MAKKSVIEKYLDKESELAMLQIVRLFDVGNTKYEKKIILNIIKKAVYSSSNATVDFFKK